MPFYQWKKERRQKKRPYLQMKKTMPKASFSRHAYPFVEPTSSIDCLSDWQKGQKKLSYFRQSFRNRPVQHGCPRSKAFFGECWWARYREFFFSHRLPFRLPARQPRDDLPWWQSQLRSNPGTPARNHVSAIRAGVPIRRTEAADRGRMGRIFRSRKEDQLQLLYLDPKGRLATRRNQPTHPGTDLSGIDLVTHGQGPLHAAPARQPLKEALHPALAREPTTRLQ